MTTLARLSALALLLATAGCALPTTQKYEAKLEPLIGQPVDELVMAWGPPQGNFTLSDGRTMIEYTRSEALVSRGGTSVGIGGWSHGPSVGTVQLSSFSHHAG